MNDHTVYSARAAAEDRAMNSDEQRADRWERLARVDPIESSPRVAAAFELRDRIVDAEDRAVQEANARAYDRLELWPAAENHAE